MKANADPLKHLFDLNQALVAREQAGQPITGPGLPAAHAGLAEVMSADCIIV